MTAATAVVSKVYTKEELCLMERVPEPCGIVIFGASGDLAHRKLFPSLFKLMLDNVLPAACYVIGVGRTPLSDEQFRASVKSSIEKDAGGNGRKDPAPRIALEEFTKRCRYFTGDYQDAGFYSRIKQQLAALDQAHQIPCRRIYYLSTPPSLYETVAHHLRDAGLARSTA